MNSRERVVTALNHQEPDRIPIDFGSLHTSIHRDGHKRLLEYLGLPVYEAPIQDPFQQIVFADEALRKKFGSDVIGIYGNPSMPWTQIDKENDIWIDEWGTKYRKPKGGFWYDFAGHYLNADSTIADLEAFKFPDPRDPIRIAGLRETAKKLNETTDKAIMIHAATGGLYEHSYWIYGMENLYTAMAANVKFVEALAEKILNWMIDYWDSVLTEIGEYVQVVQVGDDLGGQGGPLFSPRLYRQVYKPRHRRLTDAIRKKTDAKIYFHTCGSVYAILPDIIESGMDIINPAQVSAKDMDSAKIKGEFGKDLTFWGGGCDATVVMTQGTPEEVRAEARRRIHDFAPGGGFVFGSIHNMQPNVPPQNVVAMFQAAHDFGTYPITV